MSPARGAASVRRPQTRRGLGIAGLATLAIIISVTGCSAGSGASDDPNSDTAIAALGEEVHPTGDPGAWFWESYGEGLSGSYSTSNEVCGIGRSVPLDQASEDAATGVVVESHMGLGSASVIGRNLTSGNVVWEMPEASCHPGDVVADTVVIAGTGGSESERSFLANTQTGRTIMQLPEPDNAALPGSVKPIASDDAGAATDPAAARLFEVGSNMIMRVSPPDNLTAEATFPDADQTAPTGALDWATELGPEIAPVPLGDGMIGVTERMSDRIHIVDGASGEVTFETTLTDKLDLTWLSDGYMLNENESDPAYVFYDFQGDKVERTVGESQYGFHPGPAEGITYSIEDQLAASTTVGVDAAGRPALIEDAARKNQLRGATVGERDLPDSIISLQGVSREGSLLLFADNAADESPLPGLDSDGVVVIDQLGDRVIEWPLADDGVAIVAGYIVTYDGNSTHVLLPKTP